MSRAIISEEYLGDQLTILVCEMQTIASIFHKNEKSLLLIETTDEEAGVGS